MTIHKTEGFTIVELLIVVVVIAVLAAVTIVAYNGITTRTSDSSAKANMGTILKKLETQKITGQTYPLGLSEINANVGSDIRTEYSSDGTTFCLTTSSIKARTNYYQTSGGGTMTSGTCPNHLGYAGGAGSFSSATLFGASAPPSSYLVYNDGGGDLWVGNRIYTYRDNGVRVVGMRVWEPVGASSAFLSIPLSVRLYTQDWQGASLSGWGEMGSPDQTASYTGTRTAGTWTYIWFSGSATIAKVSPTAGPKDTAVAAVRYDGNAYVSPSPAFSSDVLESNMLSGLYLAEHDSIGRSVSSVYSGSSHYYYGIDLIVTPL